MATYELTVEVLSPLHIGDARGRLTALDFFQDRENVYLVEERRLAEALAREGRIDDFVRFVQSENYPALDAYLERRGPAAARILRRAVSRTIPKAEPARLTNVLPFIVDQASGRPYLPGSSLKGALRGAILHRLAGGSQELAGAKQRALARREASPGQDLDLLLRAELPRGRNRRGPNADWLRRLRLTDAYPEQQDCTEVREVRIVSLNAGGGYHFGARETQLFVEVVRPGTAFRCRLTCDTGLWELLERECRRQPPFALEDWAAVAAEKCRAVLAAEKDFFRQAGLAAVVRELERIAAQGANLRLGWGSGLLGASVVLHFSPEERQTLRQLHFPRREHPVFPQSRKVVMARGQPAATLGWVRVAAG